MNIKEIFETKLPREFSGDHVFRSYRFQIYFGANLLLNLLRERKYDACVLMDYFDDVVILDNDLNPTLIKFYQVKTKKDLRISISTALKYNFFDKMSWNVNQFKPIVCNATLVSNGGFSFNFKNAHGDMHIGGYDDFEFSGNTPTSVASLISRKSKNEEVKKIMQKYMSPESDLNQYYLLTTNFGLSDFESDFLGKLTDYFAEESSRIDAVTIKTICNYLIQKLEERQAPGIEFNKTKFDEVIQYKSFSAKAFNNLIENIQNIAIPSKFSDLYDFTTNTLKHNFSQNFVNAELRYVEFVNLFTTSLNINCEVADFLKTIKSEVENDKLFEVYDSLLASNKVLMNNLIVEKFHDLYVIVFLYKIFNR